MTAPIPVTEQLIDRARRAPTPEVAVISVLRTLVTIMYVYRGTGDADAFMEWLSAMADDIEDSTTTSLEDSGD